MAPASPWFPVTGHSRPDHTDGLRHALDPVDGDGDDRSSDPHEALLALACEDLPPLATVERVVAAIKGRGVEHRPTPDGLDELRLIGRAPR